MKHEFSPHWRAYLLVPFLLLPSYFLLSYSVEAQFRVPVGEPDSRPALNPLVASYALTNNFAAPRDTVPMRFASDQATTAPGHKSVFLAAVLSAILPGLGEYYVGDDIWRGMIFTGIEAGLWVGYFRWNQRGADSTSAFYNFSNMHFGTTKYADSLNALLAANHVSADSCNCYASGGNIASINRAEMELDLLYANDPNGDDWGHQLVNPAVNNQQYYEMISKYDQYQPGWDNIGNWSLASLMRADLNTQYDVANIFLYGIMLNHVLSAIDAALLARDHNSPLRLHSDLMEFPLPNGAMAYVPTAKIEYRF
jgi:hypothetical protein